MFMMTLSKPGLKKLGTLTVCVGLLAGVVAGVNRWMNAGSVTAGAQPEAASIGGTQDIGVYFSGRGLEVDLASTAVDQVKIPRKWDDSFTAFNEVIRQGGLDLERYKGKTVEKWLALCPARSGGDQKTYCVLLVHKQKPVGAYLLTKPSGEVSPLPVAAASAAPLTPEEQEAAASFGEGLSPEQLEAAAQPQPADQEAAAPAPEMLESDEAALAAAGIEPVE